MTEGWMQAFFNYQPLWIVGLLLFVLLSAACAGGYWLHRQPARSSVADDDSKDEGFILSAVLGLLALLVGFTFSMALGRYETRRELVVQEANALGSALLVSQLLDEPARSQLPPLMRQYIGLRLSWHRDVHDASAAGQLLARITAAQSQLWTAVAAATRLNANPLLARGLVDHMTSAFDVASARKAEAEARIPARVLQVLALYALVSALMLGYVLAGGRKRHLLATSLLFLTLSMALALILDLDRPRRGAIQVSQQPMAELLEAS